MKYKDEDLQPITWCAKTKMCVDIEVCNKCEFKVSLHREKEATENIPLPRDILKCRYPNARQILLYAHGKIVTCPLPKYSPYISIEKCDTCNYFNSIVTEERGSGQQFVLCGVPTNKTVSYILKTFETVGDSK